MVGKRHASEEISAKLAQANELAAKGKTQREISKALGVSVMTYHRWKNMLKSSRSSASVADGARDEIVSRSSASAEPGSAEKIKQLELENAQLRRLVTDMLLEKLKYEEELRSRREARLRHPDGG